jgi:hypothetical protein
MEAPGLPVVPVASAAGMVSQAAPSGDAEPEN